ncbi:MAG: class II SORL domain-containing protein [Candidatus Helarchaeota archaeon]
MVDLNALAKTADWKSEKHVPAIEVDGTTIKVTVGKKIQHPNTPEHHITWINVYFIPDGAKFPVYIGKTTFDAHGAGESTVYTEPSVTINLKTEKSGIVLAFSFCNIHGLWKDEAELKV